MSTRPERQLRKQLVPHSRDCGLWARGRPVSSRHRRHSRDWSPWASGGGGSHKAHNQYRRRPENASWRIGSWHRRHLGCFSCSRRDPACAGDGWDGPDVIRRTAIEQNDKRGKRAKRAKGTEIAKKAKGARNDKKGKKSKKC